MILCYSSHRKLIRPAWLPQFLWVLARRLGHWLPSPSSLWTLDWSRFPCIEHYCKWSRPHHLMGAVPGKWRTQTRSKRLPLPSVFRGPPYGAPCPPQSSGPLIQTYHLDNSWLSWRCHSWRKLTMPHQRALSPVKIWRNRWKSGSHTPHPVSIALQKNVNE